jgi:hypothetical protein
LPSAALGKGFAEGKVAFAECIRHSAKRLNPVVIGVLSYLICSPYSIVWTIIYTTKMVKFS